MLWIRMFFGLPDMAALLFCTARIRILPSTSKKRKKNLDFYYFVTFFDFLSMKTDVSVPSKSNRE
jgi:hypothetical protein